MNSFDIGDVIRVQCTFKVGTTPTDPTSTTLTIEKPNGTTSTPSVSSGGTGIKYGDYTAADVGYHHWKMQGTGTAAGVAQGSFYVRQGQI